MTTLIRKTADRELCRRMISSTEVDHHASVSQVLPEIRYVHHDDFDNPDAAHEILERLTESELSAEGCGDSSIHGDDFHLPDAPLLTKDAERDLFLRMNLLRMMAARRQQQMHPPIATAPQLRTIRNLVNQADAIRNQIMHANQRLVVAHAAKFQRRGVPLADLISEANLSLMKAIDYFDVERDCRLSTYASYAIIRHLSRFVRREQKRSAFAGLETVEPSVENDGLDSIDLPSVDQLRQILRMIPPRERGMVELRYGLTQDGRARTLDEIGLAFGLSRERVRQLVKRACAAICRHAAGRLDVA